LGRGACVTFDGRGLGARMGRGACVTFDGRGLGAPLGCAI
jgi:hypothetical protein